jgi:hypothetical protein
MTHEEMEAYRNRINEILNRKDSAQRELQELKELALDVGAGIKVATPDGFIRDAKQSELVYNIQHALQTASMIDACKTAASSFELAQAAQKSARISQWIALGSMLAAIATAVVSWIATNK